jgi:hypothetical protein
LSFNQTTPGSTNLLNNFSVNSSGQSVALASPLVIGGTLNLTDGLLISTSGNSLTLGAAATFTGGSDSSFVSGPLIMNTAATTSYVFPVGKATIYSPVSVTPVIQSPVVHFNGASWDPVIGTTVAGNVEGLVPVTSQIMTTFSPFTFGYGPGVALPLTLIDFKALVMATSVELSWTAANEVSAITG